MNMNMDMDIVMDMNLNMNVTHDFITEDNINISPFLHLVLKKAHSP